MAEKNNDINYTASDIEKYHKGLLSAKEMQALEKAALDDPFLADALDGYAAHTINVPADFADLKNRLSKRISEEKKVIPIITKSKTSFAWWKAAASIVLIAGTALIVYQFGFNRKSVNIAESTPNETAKLQEKKSDTAVHQLSNTDTTSMVVAQEGNDKSKTKDDKPTEAPQLKERASQASNKPQVRELSNDAVTAPPPVNAAPIAAEKTNEETEIDNITRGRVNKRMQEQKARKEQQYKADSSANAILQSIAAAEQKRSEALYKNQPNKAPEQAKIFRGRVTDDQNNALPFSNITNIQDNIGTYADANGYFNLLSPDSVLKVRVSSLGFESINVQLQNNIPNTNILLKEDRSSLAEVVISNKKINSTRKTNTLVLEEPEPADGWVNYDLYLANNLKDPGVSRKNSSGTGGEVELSFEVTKNGEPINITVKKSLSEACDREAIRLLKEGPRWKKKGKKSTASVTVGF